MKKLLAKIYIGLIVIATLAILIYGSFLGYGVIIFILTLTITVLILVGFMKAIEILEEK